MLELLFYVQNVDYDLNGPNHTCWVYDFPRWDFQLRWLNNYVEIDLRLIGQSVK